MPFWQAFWRRADAAPRSSNRETLAELLASFFAHFSAAAARWLVSNGACDVRASTWCGAWTQGSWAKSYMAGQSLTSSKEGSAVCSLAGCTWKQVMAKVTYRGMQSGVVGL